MLQKQSRWKNSSPFPQNGFRYVPFFGNHIIKSSSHSIKRHIKTTISQPHQINVFAKLFLSPLHYWNFQSMILILITFKKFCLFVSLLQIEYHMTLSSCISLFVLSIFSFWLLPGYFNEIRIKQQLEFNHAK